MLVIDQTTDESVKRVMDINFGAPLRYMREAVKVFLPKNDGCIINITSVGGKRNVFGAPYVAAKAALDALTTSDSLTGRLEGFRQEIPFSI